MNLFRRRVPVTPTHDVTTRQRMDQAAGHATGIATVVATPIEQMHTSSAGLKRELEADRKKQEHALANASTSGDDDDDYDYDIDSTVSMFSRMDIDAAIEEGDEDIRTVLDDVPDMPELPVAIAAVTTTTTTTTTTNALVSTTTLRNAQNGSIATAAMTTVPRIHTAAHQQQQQRGREMELYQPQPLSRETSIVSLQQQQRHDVELQPPRETQIVPLQAGGMQLMVPVGDTVAALQMMVRMQELKVEADRVALDAQRLAVTGLAEANSIETDSKIKMLKAKTTTDIERNDARINNAGKIVGMLTHRATYVTLISTGIVISVVFGDPIYMSTALGPALIALSAHGLVRPPKQVGAVMYTVYAPTVIWVGAAGLSLVGIPIVYDKLIEGLTAVVTAGVTAVVAAVTNVTSWSPSNWAIVTGPTHAAHYVADTVREWWGARVTLEADETQVLYDDDDDEPKNIPKDIEDEFIITDLGKISSTLFAYVTAVLCGSMQRTPGLVQGCAAIRDSMNIVRHLNVVRVALEGTDNITFKRHPSYRVRLDTETNKPRLYINKKPKIKIDPVRMIHMNENDQHIYTQGSTKTAHVREYYVSKVSDDKIAHAKKDHLSIMQSAYDTRIHGTTNASVVIITTTRTWTLITVGCLATMCYEHGIQFHADDKHFPGTVKPQTVTTAYVLSTLSKTYERHDHVEFDTSEYRENIRHVRIVTSQPDKVITNIMSRLTAHQFSMVLRILYNIHNKGQVYMEADKKTEDDKPREAIEQALTSLVETVDPWYPNMDKIAIYEDDATFERDNNGGPLFLYNITSKTGVMILASIQENREMYGPATRLNTDNDDIGWLDYDGKYVHVVYYQTDGQKLVLLKPSDPNESLRFLHKLRMCTKLIAEICIRGGTETWQTHWRDVIRQDGERRIELSPPGVTNGQVVTLRLSPILLKRMKAQQ
jgi:hypothetical protein